MSDEGTTPLPTFAPDERVCGNCKLWSPCVVEEARGWVGTCRLQPDRGLFPPSAPLCNAFSPRGGVSVVVKDARASDRSHRSAPQRTVAQVAPKIRRNGQEQVDLLGDASMTRDELMELFREAAGDPDVPPMAAKWEGGTVRMVPHDPALQPKELPIDTLFHKVVMVRDRLRTLEQKLNAHPKLSDAEKVEMQHYITRSYGSLTSFNILFREKGDQFVGAKSED